MSATNEPETNAAPAPRRVHVDLPGRAYDILIGAGLLGRAGRLLAERLPGARFAVVTDETVAGLHLPALQASLDASGLSHATVTVPAGETSKSFRHLEQVVDGILAGRFERGDAVLAFGGGVVGDLAGFAAAIVRRGMRFVQVPTTLLAQVDSSVGGKTGINSPRGKNLVGAFHQPDLVLADTGVLDTLSEREFAAGYAEVVKYGLIDRPEFFDWLEWKRAAIFAGGPERDEAIAASCEAKAAVVIEDERETGNRALLNLGHTFGHAIEAAVAFDPARLVHGEAVAIGMAQAHRFSARLGLCPGQDATRVERHLRAAGLPTRLGQVPGPAIPREVLMAGIAQDKKVKRGRLTFILTRGIGRSYIAADVDAAEVESFLAEEIAGTGAAEGAGKGPAESAGKGPAESAG